MKNDHPGPRKIEVAGLHIGGLIDNFDQAGHVLKALFESGAKTLQVVPYEATPPEPKISREEQITRLRAEADRLEGKKPVLMIEGPKASEPAAGRTKRQSIEDPLLDALTKAPSHQLTRTELGKALSDAGFAATSLDYGLSKIAKHVKKVGKPGHPEYQLLNGASAPAQAAAGVPLGKNGKPRKRFATGSGYAQVDCAIRPFIANPDSETITMAQVRDALHAKGHTSAHVVGHALMQAKKRKLLLTAEKDGVYRRGPKFDAFLKSHPALMEGN